MIDLPFSLRVPLAAAIRAAGDPSPIRAVLPLGGGCINNARRLDTAQASYFLKWNERAPAGMFLTEAHGLALLRATVTVRVPEVYAAEDAAPGRPAFILQEFLEGGRSVWRPDQALLGQALAMMHRLGHPPRDLSAYGLDQDNYLGSSPQPNGWMEDWAAFFRERRLRPQMELAARNGRLPAERRRRLEDLLDRLDELLGGVERRPALLHGDLWGGNVLPGPGGKPALIDPAVYYGDREAEIAFTELFGGFTPRFYAAYNEVWPLNDGYAQRRDLYNLYHLLNHLNLFGEGYGYEVDSVLRRYSRR